MSHTQRPYKSNTTEPHRSHTKLPGGPGAVSQAGTVCAVPVWGEGTVRVGGVGVEVVLRGVVVEVVDGGVVVEDLVALGLMVGLEWGAAVEWGLRAAMVVRSLDVAVRKA